jgi:aspartate racemase
MKNKNVIIGIIGGAGVKAGVELAKRIENKVTDMGAYRDCHHPEIILWQATSAPSRSMFLEGRGPSFINSYISIAKNLKKCGANVLCMSCNTAHAAIEKIEKKAEIPFIDLLKETSITIEKKFPAGARIGILCSKGTADHKLYDRYFNQYSSKAVLVYPDQKYQTIVSQGICAVKDTNDMSKANKIFHKVIFHLEKKRVDAILVACTDISLALGEKDFKSGFLDTTDVLADAIITYWLFNTNPQFMATKANP